MTTLPPNIPPYGPSLSLADAKRVMDAAEKEAAKNNWPMVIAIVDAAGHLLMLHKMDQAQTGSILIAQKKAETAANFRRSTKIFQDGLAAGGSVESEEVSENIILDYDSEGRVVGIDIQHASKHADLAGIQVRGFLPELDVRSTL